MAAFYLDEGVSREVAPGLHARGHVVETTDELNRRGSTDDDQLLTAAARGRILVVHNRAHFMLFHGAWRKWSNAWQISPEHAGIVIVPQTWSSFRIAREIDLLKTQHPTITNQLWQWQPRAGWVERS